MTLVRMILSDWRLNESQGMRRVIEGQFTDEQIAKYNADGYNIYALPNHPREYQSGTTVDGTHIDVFNWVFCDMDLKDEAYSSKDEFLEALGGFPLTPSKIVDSGNGVHCYWRISDLDAMSYLRLQRRLCRTLITDPAVGQIFQLMRLPNTLNTKRKGIVLHCHTLYDEPTTYTCEQLDKVLPPITPVDEQHCQQHFNKTYSLDRDQDQISDKIPAKFGKLITENAEARAIWADPSDDRSKKDFRLGHLMYANGFTREEAITVLGNTAKALTRAPIHRLSYAQNIIDKIFTYEKAEDKKAVNLSPSVRDILARGDDVLAGRRFACHKWIDDTKHGFRLGQVIGIIGGSGVGKTTLTLNAFLWFAQRNPDFHHFFFSLEQPVGEIAKRIRTICGDDDSLYDKIHLVSNYEEDGSYKHLSLSMIEEHMLEFQTQPAHKIGSAVIDHIGVLSKNEKNGENDGLIGICRQMKAVAQRVNVMLIMLSQAPREKAGWGDLELDKSAAYGTVFFESFVDYCLCLWQPLKRVYTLGAPTVIAIKFAKIRHKLQGKDRITEDTCYQFFFDPATERIREMTQDEEQSANYFQGQAVTLRKKDKKTDLVEYTSRRLEDTDAEAPGTGRTATH